MAKGYCSTCRALVDIRPGRKHASGSSRDWLPQPHPFAGLPGAPSCDGDHRPAGDVEFAPPPRITIDLSDPEDRAVWEAAKRAAEEVASWPPWKRGES